MTGKIGRLWKWVFGCISGGLTASCGGNVILFPPEPQIEMAEVRPTVIREGEVLNLSVRYRDGDGDLGDNTRNADRPTFVVVDLRPNLEWFLPEGTDSTYLSGFLPNLSPETRSPSIQGTITMRLEGLYVLDPNLEEETFRFAIRIIDRKGNVSNRVVTPEITIKR